MKGNGSGEIWRLDCSWWVRPDDAENRVVYPIEALVIVHPRVGWGRSLKLTFKDVTKCKRLGIAGTKFSWTGL